MAFVNKDHVFKIMRANECAYWRITDNTGMRHLVDENETEDNVQNAIELMEATINDIEDNNVCVVISNKTKKEKSGGGRNYKQFEFKVNLRKTETGFNGSTGMFGMIMQQMKENAELMRKLEIQQKEKEMDELRREMKELKEGGTNALAPYMPYLDKFFGIEKSSHGIASTGHEDETVDESVVDKQKQVREAIIRLAKIDSDLPNTLTLLAMFAEKNPAKYKSFIPMLQNMM
jgi:hypothetical protein